MAEVQHVDIDDPFIHEPKGASAASANTIYVADGSGSGTWKLVENDSFSTDNNTAISTAVAADIADGTIASLPPEVFLQVAILDVSTADTIYVPVPAALTVQRVSTVLQGALTDADATITVKNAAGASMGTMTIPFTGSGAGDVATLVPASNNTIAADTFLTVETDGASTGAQLIWATLYCTIDTHFSLL